jgi:NadR type nicotinamide-nucleotide adenylyltransferase
MRKVAITGPESSGKTTLAMALAAHFRTAWVPEYARLYLDKYGPEYEEGDVLNIAKGQANWELTYARDTRGDLLICDTDLLVLKIWSEVKFQHCHPWIERHLHTHAYDLYLLCSPDIPWEPDPLREHPEQRHELYLRYLAALVDMKADYTIIKGTDVKDRLKQAIRAIES